MGKLGNLKIAPHKAHDKFPSCPSGQRPYPHVRGIDHHGDVINCVRRMKVGCAVELDPDMPFAGSYCLIGCCENVIIVLAVYTFGLQNSPTVEFSVK